jgi:hypothetical protein
LILIEHDGYFWLSRVNTHNKVISFGDLVHVLLCRTLGIKRFFIHAAVEAAVKMVCVYDFSDRTWQKESCSTAYSYDSCGRLDPTIASARPSSSGDNSKQRDKITNENVQVPTDHDRASWDNPLPNLTLVWKRRSNPGNKLGVRSFILRKVIPCFGKTERSVRTTPSFIRVVIVLSVVFPKTNWTKFKPSASVKCLESAARTPVSCVWFVWFRHALEHSAR